jgi:transposase-like protein
MSKITEKCPSSFLGLGKHRIVEKAVVLFQYRKDGKMMYACEKCNRLWAEEDNSPLPKDFLEQFSKEIDAEMNFIRSKYGKAKA